MKGAPGPGLPPPPPPPLRGRVDQGDRDRGGRREEPRWCGLLPRLHLSILSLLRSLRPPNLRGTRPPPEVRTAPPPSPPTRDDRHVHPSPPPVTPPPSLPVVSTSVAPLMSKSFRVISHKDDSVRWWVCRGQRRLGPWVCVCAYPGESENVSVSARPFSLSVCLGHGWTTGERVWTEVWLGTTERRERSAGSVRPQTGRDAGPEDVRRDIVGVPVPPVRDGGFGPGPNARRGSPPGKEEGKGPDEEAGRERGRKTRGGPRSRCSPYLSPRPSEIGRGDGRRGPGVRVPKVTGAAGDAVRRERRTSDIPLSEESGAGRVGY